MVTCSGFVEPLNLQCILVNALAGTMEIFIFLSLLLIAGMAAHFRMLSSTALLMFAVFGIIISQYFNGILFLVILIGGLITAVSLSKIPK